MSVIRIGYDLSTKTVVLQAYALDNELTDALALDGATVDLLEEEMGMTLADPTINLILSKDEALLALDGIQGVESISDWVAKQ